MASLRIIAVPSSDNGSPLLPVFYIQVEGARYLFNVPESTTRSLTQRKTSFARCGHVFLSAIGADSSPGLAGLLMTLADAGRSELSIHGPQTLAHAIATMRFYAKRDTMNLHIQQYPHAAVVSEEPFFRDNNVAIEAVQLLPSPQLADQERVSKKQRVVKSTFDLTKKPWINPAWRPAQLTGEDAEDWVHAVVQDMFHLKAATKFSSKDALDDPSATRGRPVGPAWVPHPLPDPVYSYQASGGSQRYEDSHKPALCYIVRSHPQRGKFDPSAALAAGVPSGPAWASLTKGESVRVLRPKQMATWEKAVREQWTRESSKKGTTTTAANTTAKGRKKGKQAKGLSSVPLVPEILPEELEDVVVRPEEVMGPRRPGFVVIQIYIPSEAHAISFFAEKVQRKLARFCGPSTHDEPGDAPTHNAAHLVIHCVLPSILYSAPYQSWMRSFPRETHHMLSSASVCTDNFAFPSAAMTLLRLQALDPDIFKLPHYELTAPTAPYGAPCEFPPQTMPVEPDLIVSLLPCTPPQRFASGAPDFDFEPQSAEALLAMSYQRPDSQLPPQRKQVRSESQTNRTRLQQARERTWSEYTQLAAQTRDRVAAEASRRDSEGQPEVGEGVIITPLGTGSAHPSKYRNVSSTLVQTASHGNILLDAGEGTYGQLRRRFAQPRMAGEGHAVDKVIRDLKCIFISHIHADHHLGVAKILIERRKLLDPPCEPLYIVSNSFTRTYLLDYDKIESIGLAHESSRPNGVIFIESEHLDFETGVQHGNAADGLWRAQLLEGFRQRDATKLSGSEAERAVDRMVANREQNRQHTRQASSRMRELLGCTELSTVLVDHRAAHCYGLVLRNAEGWSLAYSGDTRPCAALARAAMGVTVLLHEATLQDDEALMAHRKGHSTVGQAIQIAKEAQVDHLILTHFSQRYPKLARRGVTLEANQRESITPSKELTISSAFDLISIPMVNLWKVDRYQAAMEKLFEADVDEGDTESEAGSLTGPTDKHRTGGEGVDHVEQWLTDTQRSTAVLSGKQMKFDGVTCRLPNLPPLRQNVTNLEWRYVCLKLKSDGAMSTPPTAQALHFALQTALLQMHGLVGGSIRFDILRISDVAHNTAEALIRINLMHLAKILTAVSGPAICLRTSNDTLVRVLFSRQGLSITALVAGGSAAWLEGLSC